MEFVNAYKSSSIIYDLDTTGGLMEEVQRLIAPPLSDSNKRDKKNLVNNFGYKKPKANNHEYCDSCYEGGDLLCCDKCPVSFHLQCYDPPFSEETAPKGFWICRRCKSQLDILKNASNTSSMTYTKHMQFSSNSPKNPFIDNQKFPQHFKLSCNRTYISNANLKFPIFQEIQLYDLKPNNNLTYASNPNQTKQNNEISKYLNKLSDQDMAQLNTLKRKKNISDMWKRWSCYMSEPLSRLSHNSYLHNPTEFKLPKNMSSHYNFPGSAKSKNSANSVSNSIPVTSSVTNIQNNQTWFQPHENEISKTLTSSQLTSSEVGNLNSAKRDVISDNFLWTSSHTIPIVKNKISYLPHELDNHNLVSLPPKVCFVCSRSCQKQILLQCDYCPLLYHLDCLDPPLTFPPSTQWMCPNHPEHLLEERLWKSNSLAERIKVWEILPADDNSSANPSSFTVKAKFLHKVHRKHPPFRYKIKHPGRTRIRVPDDIRKSYQTYRGNDGDKLCEAPSHYNSNNYPYNEMANCSHTFPPQTNSNNTISYTPATEHHLEPRGKALLHEQEEFISSLMTLQARTATPSHDVKIPTNHGWLGKEAPHQHYYNITPPQQSSLLNHTIPESPNLISRLIHRLQDHLSPPSVNLSQMATHTTQHSSWSDTGVGADTNFSFAIPPFDCDRVSETGNLCGPSICNNGSSSSRGSSYITNSVSSNTSSLTTLKFSLSNLKLKNLSIAPKNNLPPMMPTSLLIRQFAPPFHKSLGHHHHQSNGLKRGSSVDTPLVVSSNSDVIPNFKSTPSLTDPILLTPVVAGVDFDRASPTSTLADKNQVIKVLRLNNAVKSLPFVTKSTKTLANGTFDEEVPPAESYDVKCPSRRLDFIHDASKQSESEFCVEKGENSKSDSPVFNGTGDPFSKQLAELLDRRETILARNGLVENGEKGLEFVNENPLSMAHNKMGIDKMSSFAPTLNGYSLPNGIGEEICNQVLPNKNEELHGTNFFKDPIPAKAILYPPYTFHKPYIVSSEYLTIGAGSQNELNLENFGLCKFVSPRHACLFYDEENGEWDVINQSFYGTTIIRPTGSTRNYTNNGSFEMSSTYKTPQCICCDSPPLASSHEAMDCKMLIFDSAKLQTNDILKFGCIRFTFAPTPKQNDDGES